MTQSCSYLPARGKSARDKDGCPIHLAQRATVTDRERPRYRSHRFWSHKSATENLIFSAWADPCKGRDHILDVNFLRNAVGYLADCEKSGLQPSLFQMVLFWHNASSLISPKFCGWMPIWLLVWIHIVGAWVAETMLG